MNKNDKKYTKITKHNRLLRLLNAQLNIHLTSSTTNSGRGKDMCAHRFYMRAVTGSRSNSNRLPITAASDWLRTM